jgi:anthranilate phosphoribosyltransferase
MRDVVSYLSKVVQHQDLSEDEAADAMRLIMRGEATSNQIAGFMVALRVKGETGEEITGLLRTVRDLAVPVELDGELLDVVGTGGDGLATFNISTLAAIVAAACGAKVAKHGNRAASSRCGSADLLEALGVRIDLGPEGAARCVAEAGIGFLFAPLYHPSFRFVAAVRRELGVRTIFNVLGPLCNPARVKFQAMGVAEPSLVGRASEVLPRLGVRRALVFHGAEGMDELSTSGPSSVVEVIEGHYRQYELDPRELGLKPAFARELCGGDAVRNAAIARDLLAGEPGPGRDVVLLNAAAGLRAAGVAGTWQEGIGLAAEAIDGGSAGAILDRWIRTSHEVAPE